ncbi:MAG: DUF58 domain-containing protein [Isosphaeraceae bacterium]
MFYSRVPGGGGRERLRWTGVSPRRGRYKFRTLELVTRSPFGLLERRVTINENASMIVYPMVGHLTRRWHLLHRQASETRADKRHDRSSQQQEYHGLRDYRPGDSPRWIHWRTSARLAQPMVKEFGTAERAGPGSAGRPLAAADEVDTRAAERLEQAIRFAATVCLETCRRGSASHRGLDRTDSGVCQGPASVKLLHELPTACRDACLVGGVGALLDALPPSTIREAILVIVSTRPINLVEEAERSRHCPGRRRVGCSIG